VRLNNRCTLRARSWASSRRRVGGPATSRCGFVPNVADALARPRGSTYLKLTQLDAAIRDYDAALRAKPQMAEAAFSAAVCRPTEKKGRRQRAADQHTSQPAKAAQGQHRRTLRHIMASTGF